MAIDELDGQSRTYIAKDEGDTKLLAKCGADKRLTLKVKNIYNDHVL